MIKCAAKKRSCNWNIYHIYIPMLPAKRLRAAVTSCFAFVLPGAPGPVHRTGPRWDQNWWINMWVFNRYNWMLSSSTISLVLLLLGVVPLPLCLSSACKYDTFTLCFFFVLNSHLSSHRDFVTISTPSCTVYSIILIFQQQQFVGWHDPAFKSFPLLAFVWFTVYFGCRVVFEPLSSPSFIVSHSQLLRTLLLGVPLLLISHHNMAFHHFVFTATFGCDRAWV